MRHVVAGARFLVDFEVPFFEEEDFFAEAVVPVLFDTPVLAGAEAFPDADVLDDLAALFFASVFPAVAAGALLALADDFFLAVDAVCAHSPMAAHASTHAHPRTFRIVFLPV